MMFSFIGWSPKYFVWIYEGQSKSSRNGGIALKGRIYGNAYLITLKVRPLLAHTLAPSILPLLGAAVEGFFWNLPELRRRIRFDVLHGCPFSE
jgi:hypothetical protein